MQRPKSCKKQYYPISPDNINQLSHVSTTSSFNSHLHYSPYQQQELLLHTLSQKITHLRQNVTKFQGLKLYRQKLLSDYDACYEQHSRFQKDMETLQLNSKNAIKSLIKDHEKAFEQMAVANDSQQMVELQRKSLKDRCQLLLQKVLTLEESQKKLTEKHKKIKQEQIPIQQNIKKENEAYSLATENIQSLRKQVEKYNNQCNLQQSNNNFAVKEENNKKYQLQRSNIRHQQILQRLNRLQDNIVDNESLIARKDSRNNEVAEENQEIRKQIDGLMRATQLKQQSTRVEQQKFLLLRQDETQMNFQLKQLEQTLQNERLGYKRDIQAHLRELQRKQQNVFAFEKLSQHLRNLVWTNSRLQEQLNTNIIGDFSMIRHLGKTKAARQDRAHEQWIKDMQIGNKNDKKQSYENTKINQDSISVLRQKSINNFAKQTGCKFTNSQWLKQGSIYDQIKMHESSSSNRRMKQQSQIEQNQQNQNAPEFKQSISYSTRASRFMM